MARLIDRLAKSTTKIYTALWLAMPVVVWFSYHPNIHLGQDATMNFEISLPLILLVLLAAASVPFILAGWRGVMSREFVWMVVALGLFSILTVFWSVNPLRSLLTGGIVGLLLLVFLGAVAQKEIITKLLPRLTKIFIISAVVMSLLAVVQFILGVWLPQGATLLCNGCVPQQFGFVRPNVFAIEPQFFGNMLLAPLLILVHRVFSGKARWLEYVGLSVMLLALFLTMSRGAIYALVVGLAILLIVRIKQWRNIVKFAGVSMLSLVAALSMQGVAASVSPHVSETFIGAVGKSINQLSMGVIEIRPSTEGAEETSQSIEPDKDAPAFDGYVEESTDIRLGRTELALKTWQKDPATMAFGVGLGGSGVAVYQAFPAQTGAREIVQNEYTERLLERGLIGLGLTLAAVIALVYGLRRHKWLWAIIAAFGFQLMMFSGYPNALHIYLTLILLSVAWLNGRKISYL